MITHHIFKDFTYQIPKRRTLSRDLRVKKVKICGRFKCTLFKAKPVIFSLNPKASTKFTCSPSLRLRHQRAIAKSCQSNSHFARPKVPNKCKSKPVWI